MFPLLLKEIRSFLSSLIGYIAIGVFLLLTGLFLFVFDTGMNIFNGTEASLYNLFELAPFVFMFLIPAITMRSFAEEKRLGTIELLLTKPLTDYHIILSKFFAGFLLVIFAIVPTLIYYFCIDSLTDDVSKVDTGEMWGSYIGLLFLGGAYVAIGIFASSLSGNQVVAFILAMALCFFVYMGFDLIGSWEQFGTYDNVILGLGILEHYKSISYGVIDSRDIVYFVSVVAFFLILTKAKLASRKW